MPVQWGDEDSFGHVNNVVYIRWLETARIAYMEQCGLQQWLRRGSIGPILASIHCDYRRPIHYPDTVLLGSRLAKLGNSSITIAHVVYSQQQAAVAAEGQSVVVFFNYDENRAIPLPPELRQSIERLEAGEHPAA